MKSKLFVFLIFLLAISNFSVAQTADVVKGCSPLEVKFTAPSGSSTFFWDFKDGVTSDQQNPTNIFTKAGTYNVTFHHSVGGPVVGTVQITVYPDPALNVQVSEGCSPTKKFTNISEIDPAITVNNYVWVFGDGQRSEGVQNPTYTYGSTSTSRNISFEIQTNFPTCNRTKVFPGSVTFLTPPSAAFSTNPTQLSTCNDSLMVSFSNLSSGIRPLTYAWNFGNGNTSSLENPPVIQKYNKGTWTPTLTVSYQGIDGCTSSYSTTVSVGTPVTNLFKQKDTVCIFSNTFFRTTTPGVYNWDFGPNAQVQTSGQRDTMYVYFTQPGLQTVRLTVSSFNGQCSSSRITTVFVDQVTAEIKSVPTFSCQSPATIQYNGISNQTNVSYKWTFPDQTTSTLKSPVKTYKSSTDSIYYSKNDFEPLPSNLIVVSNKTGCEASASIVDTLWLPNALFMPDITKGCKPLTVTFSDSSSTFEKNKIVSWKWLFGNNDSETKNDKSAVSYTYTEPGEYLARLLVTTERGCFDTSYAVLIEVGDKLNGQLDFTASKSDVCPGETLQFNVTSAPEFVDAFHFYTEGERAFHCSDQKDLTWSYLNQTGPQSVSLEVDYNGCFTKVTKNNLVTVKGAIARINYNAFCNDPLVYNFTNQSLDATSISWNFGDGQTSTDNNVSHTYAASGNYTVTLTAQGNDCPASVDTKIVRPRKVEAKIKRDSLVCINSTYEFDASTSVDVHSTSCVYGYTWQFPTIDRRPYTTYQAKTPFAFNTPGIHTVRLITTDINGCKDTATADFKVFDMVLSASVDDDQICIPATVQFTDISAGDTTLVSWNWNFGDGNTSNIRNPSHNYTNPANGPTYYAGVTVTDALGCTESFSVPVGYYAPYSSIVISDPYLCLGDEVFIQASDYTEKGSYLTFSWDFDNGSNGTNQSYEILYTEARDYTVKLNFREVATGCEGSTSAVISVQDYPKAVITTNVDDQNVLCAPVNVFFRDATTSTFPIVIRNLELGNGETTSATEYSLFYEKGFYDMQYIVSTSNGCADTVKRQFKVYRPEGRFETNKTTICKGESITFTLKDTADVGSYTWAFGDGNIVYDKAPVTHQYNFHPPSGQTVAKLVLYGENGICPVEQSQPVNIHQVIADFIRNNGADTAKCINDGPYKFTNTSVNISDFTWDFGDGNTSKQSTLEHSYANPGTYNVTLYAVNNQIGCNDAFTAKAVIHDFPKVAAVGDTVCQGDTLFLKVTNPNPTSTYLWSPASYLTNSSTAQTKSYALHTIIYDVMETDTNGCKGNIAVPANVIEPAYLFDWDTTIVVGDIATIPAHKTPFQIFTWTPDNGLSCLDCNFPVTRPLKDTTYLLNVTDILGCFTRDYKYDIYVRPETFVKLPTTFTPNGDGNNDFIHVRGWGIKELIEFKIFNRWGQLLYSSSNIDEGWDGKFNGVIQNSDLYVYKVKVKTWKDEEIYKEGYINLVY
ncbi:MAG: PKD domain-containing protein [Cytophagaceae bacterium]